jgi:hypothetical protein
MNPVISSITLSDRPESRIIPPPQSNDTKSTDPLLSIWSDSDGSGGEDPLI